MSAEERFRQNNLNLLTLSVSALDKIEFINQKNANEMSIQTTILSKIEKGIKHSNNTPISISKNSIGGIGKSIGSDIPKLVKPIESALMSISMSNLDLANSISDIATSIKDVANRPSAPINVVPNIVNDIVLPKDDSDIPIGRMDRILYFIEIIARKFDLSGIYALNESISKLISKPIDANVDFTAFADFAKKIDSYFEKFDLSKANMSLNSLVDFSKKYNEYSFIEQISLSMMSLNDLMSDIFMHNMKISKEYLNRFTTIINELGKQTMALESMLSSMATTQPMQNRTETIVKKEKDYSDTTKNIMLFVSAIIAFGLALNLVKDIKAVNILAFTGAIYMFVQLFEKLVQIKGFDEENVKKISKSMVIMSMAMPLIGFFLGLMPIIPMEKYASIAFISLASLPLAYSFSRMLEVFKDNKIGMKEILLAATAFPLMTLGLVMSAYALMMLPEQFISGNQLKQIFLLGLAVMPLGLLFGALSMLNMSLKDVLVTSLMLPLMSLGLVASVYILTELLDFEDIKLPSIEFMVRFSANFLVLGAITALLGLIPLSIMATGVGNLVLIAGGLVAVSHILSYANEEFFEEGGMLDKLAISMKVIFYEIGSAFLMLLKDALPIIGTVLDYMATFAEKFIVALLPFNYFITTFADAIKIIVESLTPLLQSAFNGIVSVVTVGATVLMSAFQPLSEIIVTAIQGAVTALVTFVDLFKTILSYEPDRILKTAGAIGALAISVGGLAASIAGASIAGFASAMVEGATAVVEYLAGVDTMTNPIELINSMVEKEESIFKASDSIGKIVLSLDNLSKIQLAEENAMQKVLYMIDSQFEDGYEESNIYFMGMALENLNKHIDVLIQYQEGLNQIADSFDRIGISMGVFKDNINMIELEKLTLVNDIFTNSIKFLETRDSNSLAGISEEISSGIKDAVGKATDIIFAKKEESESSNEGLKMSDLLAFKDMMLKELMLINDMNKQEMNAMMSRLLGSVIKTKEID